MHRRQRKRILTCLGVGVLFILILNALSQDKVNTYYARTSENASLHQPESIPQVTPTQYGRRTEWQPTSFPAGNTKPNHIHSREFIKMKFGPLFIFGTAGSNSSERKTWDHFKVYGLFDKNKYNKSNLTCCFMSELGNKAVVQAVAPVAKRVFVVPSDMWSFYVACANERHSGSIIPKGVAITIDNYTCSEDHVTYVRPFLPTREPYKIAIGTKTSFGTIDPELIIEWMEAYKYLGVNKVVTYFLKSLNDDAFKVLSYYASTGFLDLTFYEPANEAKYPRVAQFHEKVSQRWNDQSTVVDDSFERMSGYRYFGIIDHDEFFIPAKNKTIMQMLRHLETLYLDAAGFLLKSQYYFLSWGKHTDSDMILGSFTKREDTEPRIDNNKNFYMPSRVAFGGVDTHAIHAAKGYRIKYLDAKYGYIRHFRHCRTDAGKYPICMNETRRVVDYEIANWSKAFSENVRNVRKTVLGI